MSSDNKYSLHLEEFDNAEKENRPVLVSRLFRYDHLKHNIPYGSLVEVEVSEYKTDNNGMSLELRGKCVLYVVGHMRDCDGTPLYMISDIPVSFPREEPVFSETRMMYSTVSKLLQSGIAESDLKPIGKTVALKTIRKYLE